MYPLEKDEYKYQIRNDGNSVDDTPPLNKLKSDKDGVIFKNIETSVDLTSGVVSFS